MRVGRYDNPWKSVDWHRAPAPGVGVETYPLETADAAISHGWLYARGGERSVVCLMHPKADFSHHYLVPLLTERGIAVFCQNSRWVGNDMQTVHERVLLDVAAGLAAMRARFERVVLVGNSGGGSLYSYYLGQALAPAGARETQTPAGDAFDLNGFELPAADALVCLAAHPGEGHFLLHAIDPSLTDEADPLSCDPALDLYDPANGFAPPPAPSEYATEFLDRYRAAQRARVQRIDARARAIVARRRAARARAVETGATADVRATIATELIVVHRTDADPRCVSPSLDPSARDYGSLYAVRPDLVNYGPFGFARMLTPEAWLSTWSGLSSRAEIARNGPRITLPTLQIAYAGDNCIFPDDQATIARSLANAASHERVDVDGDHYGFPVDRGREAAATAVADWLGKTP